MQGLEFVELCCVRPKQKGHISSIVTSSGESVTSLMDIVHSFNNHFSELYQTRGSVLAAKKNRHRTQVCYLRAP